MKKKIALVSPIFSPHISGGAEKHALNFAILLSEEYDLEILSTQALDYITWKNVIQKDLEVFGNSIVRRFPVNSSRSIKSFNHYHEKLIQKIPEISEKEMSYWMKLQGPYCPKLIDFIHQNESSYDVFIFMTYLYYTTVYGIERIKQKSICVTTLHDEPPAYFPIFKKTLTNEITYSFNTPEERDLFKKIYSYEPEKYSIIGMHIDSPMNTSLNRPDFDYILYIGRIDAGKGVFALTEQFTEWKKKYNSNLKLVLIGGGEHGLGNEDIIFTGYVSEEEKVNYLKHALFLVNPSHLESFSIVVMESWLLEIPVLVNADSEILRAHCNRSNAGLYYSDQDSFSATMNFLLSNPEVRQKMGVNGKKYVEMNYARGIVQKKLFSLVNGIDSTRSL